MSLAIQENSANIITSITKKSITKKPKVKDSLETIEQKNIKKLNTKRDNKQLKIDAELLKKYPLLNIKSNNDLTYDNNIKEEYKKYIQIVENKVNYLLLNKLPALKLKTILVEDDNEDHNNEDNTKDILIDENQSINLAEDDIDKECLEKEKIGNKYYYIDHNKGLIYDLEYTSIGYIDDYGEINLE